MGLAAPLAREGDVVVVLYGGNVPYVLRSTQSPSNDEQLWELVGEAYVHGIMEGEALSRTELHEQLVTFIETRPGSIKAFLSRTRLFQLGHCYLDLDIYNAGGAFDALGYER
jgi:predicted glycosyl hydrolase (DUF1957 family)